jgi:hypothetical protein
MNKEENNFEEFLRSKLENHTVEVSDSVWANIEKKQKKRERFIWFKQYLNVFLAMDIILMISFAAFTLFNNNEVKSENNTHAVVLQKNIATPVSIVEAESDKMTSTSETNGNEIKKNEPIKVDVKEKNIELNKVNVEVKHSNKYNAQNLVAEQVEIKKSYNSRKNIIAAPSLPQVLHDQLLNKNQENLNLNWAYLRPISVREVKVASSSAYDLAENNDKISLIPSSIVLSKPKSVLKREQKNKEKLQNPSNAAVQLLESKKEEENLSSNSQVLNSNLLSSPVVNTSGEAESAPMDTIYGQKRFNGYLAIDALISPEIAGRTLKTENQTIQNYISKRDSAEGIRLSYGASVRFNLFVNKNLFFNTGINYAQRREKFLIIHKWQTHEPYVDSSKYVTYVDPFAGNTIYKTYDTLDYVTTHRDSLNHDLVMQFVDIPAMVGYKWIGKRSGIAIQGGLMFNLLFKQKGTIANYDYTANDIQLSNQDQFNKTAGISLCGGICTNHKITDRFELLIEPHATYILKPITAPTFPIEQRIFSYGLRLGMRIKL